MNTNTTIDFTADIIDVRDVIERAEEIETEAEELMGDDSLAGEDAATVAGYLRRIRDKGDVPTELADELEMIAGVLADLRGNGGDEQWRGDWYPVTLIRDSYFVEYARDLVHDIGDLPRNVPSYLEIDWERTAENIRQDYTSVEIDGETYWYR